MAILVALIIIYTSYKLVLCSYKNLTDYHLLDTVLDRVLKRINNYKSEFIEVHKIRGRKEGSEQHIDFHLVLAPNMNLTKMHDLCDKIEDEIKVEFPNANVMIHLEPN